MDKGGVTSNTDFNFSGFNKSIAIGDFNSDGVQDFVTTNFNYSTVSIRLGGIAEINLKGNSVNIVSGDTSPASADDTDFGFAVLNTNKTKTYTIENTGSGAITISSIEISGTDAALFKKHFSLFLPLTIEAGTSFNFTLTFKATNLGEKTAIVTINNNDCDEGAYIFNVKATIVPSLGNYSDPSITNAGGNATVSPDAAPTGGASVTAYTTTDFKGLLAVDQSTGVVAITNAHPAGTYAVTVDAGFGITKTFTLTVGNTLCSQGQFYAPAIPQIGVGGTPTSVAVGDFNGDGKQDIATSNSSNNNSYSGTTVSIRLGNGLGGFSGTTEILVGFNSMSLAIGDFNGDGKQDIAATASANSTGAGTVSFHLGDGLGGFSGSTEVAVGYSPYSIAISDFNGDGKQDIATANKDSDSVSIRLGDGLGGFSGTTEVDVGVNPYFVAIGDFNGDGKQDIATVNDLPASSFVSIRLGDGLGGFSGSTSIAVKADSRSLAIGDFNGDGKQDFAASSTNYVSIRLGDGLGGFSGSTNFLATGDPLAIGDFNGDGKQDIATCGYVTSIRLGDGQGGFSFNTQFDVGTHGDRKGIAIGDFNGDGKQDIAAANFESKVVSIRLSAIAEINLTSNSIDIPNGNTSIATADNTDFGNGFTITKTFTIQNTGTGLLTINSIGISGADASFFTKSGITLPTTIAPGIEANFNLNYTSTSLGTKTATVTITNDDCEDGSYTFIVQATSLVPTLGNYAAITIATAGGNASITPSAVPTNNGLGITATTRADFKGKLTVDAAAGAVRVTNAHPAGTYQITVNAGFGVSETFILTVGNTLCSEGQFLPATSLNVGENPALTEIADFNNDGYQDFVVALTSTKAVAIRLGNGSGGFTTSTTLTFSQNINHLTVNDVNGDGNADIIINASTMGSIRLGDGSGGFTSGFDFYIGTTSSTSILSEDFDQDGKIDLAVNYGSGFSILKGNGQGGFNPLNTYSTTSGIQTNFIVKGDFNGDGFTDLSMGIPSSGDNYIYFGDGLGGFGSSTIYHLDSLIRFSTVGDFDGDGKSDILSALGNTPGTVAFQRNNGDGTFAIPTYIAVGDRAVQAVSGDFNGDGKLDFATGSSALSTVSVRYGNGDGTFYGTTELLTNAPAPASSLRLIVGDFNNDGVQDIGSANNTSTTDDFSIFLGASRDINLKGNAIDIVSGDNSPDVVDDTDFGPVALNTPTAKTYTIQNGGTTNLTIASISLSGVDAASFTVGGITLPAIIPGGNSTTFTITVNASTIGIKLADVIINSDDCDEGNYSFRVQRSGPYVWNGSTSTDWSTASNWTPSVVPASSTYVNIPTGLSIYPVLSTGVSITELTMASGSSLDLGAFDLAITGDLNNNGTISGTGVVELNGSSLQGISGSGTVHNTKINNSSGGVAIGTGSTNKMYVTGVYTPTSGVLTTNGNLIFRSTSTKEGVVGTAGTCPTEPISGDVTLEKYIPARRAFRFLTPGVTSSTTINANWQEGRSVNSTAGYPFAGGTSENPASGYGTHITGVGGAANGFDASLANSPSIFTFDASSYAWLAESNTTTAGNVFNRGEAYRLFVRGDRGVSLNTDSETPTATTLRTTGVLKVCESMTFTTTSPIVPLSGVASRYSFIGNPYRSVVDWHLVSKTNVEENLYYWDPTVSGTNGRGAYVTYNQATVSNNLAGSAVDRYIQPGQAFFVRNKADVGVSVIPSVTFEASDIVGVSPSHTSIFGTRDQAVAGEAVMGTEEVLTSGIEKIHVSLFIKNKMGSGPADAFLVAYGRGFSDNYGREDAMKFSNPDENISALYKGNRQSILGLASVAGNVVKSDTIPISLSNLYAGAYVLKVSIDKHVRPEGEMFVLNRVNGQHYRVDPEKGLDLEFSAALGEKTKDDLALVVNSRAVVAPLALSKELVLYPNPTVNGVMGLQVPLPEAPANGQVAQARVEIRTVNHRLVIKTQVALDERGSSTVNIASLSAGMYVVRVEVGNKTFTAKLVKQ